MSIAVDTAYESQALAGGFHLRARAIVFLVVLAAVIGGAIGAAFGNESGPH